MSDDEIRAVLDRLVGSLADEEGDWNGVLERSGVRVRTRQLRSGALVLIGAVVAVSALVALFVAWPWRGGPDIIGRAAAAIEIPTHGQILYERIQIRASFADVVTRLSRQGRLPRRLRGRILQQWVGNANVWVEGASPRRFRFTITGRWEYANGVVVSTPAEIGGILSSFDGLAYDSRLRVLLPVAFDYPITQSVLDPAAFVKAALTSHRAKVEGTTVIDGRKAIRIRVRARVFGQLEPVADYFVDAHTYRPIRVVINEGIAPNNGPALPGMPLTSLTEIEQATVPAAGGSYVFDIREYQHLPTTIANGKLTDIRALHPHAKTD